MLFCNAYLKVFYLLSFYTLPLFLSPPFLFLLSIIRLLLTLKTSQSLDIVPRRHQLQLDHSISRERVLNRQSRIIADSHRVLLIKTLPIIWQLVVRCCHGIGDHSNPFFSRSSLSCPPSSSPATKSLFNRCGRI